MKDLLKKLICLLTIFTLGFNCSIAQNSTGNNPPPIVLEKKKNGGNGQNPRMPEFENEVACYVNASSLTITFAEPEGNAQVYVYDISGSLVGYTSGSTYAPITVSHSGVAYSVTVITDYGNCYEGTLW